MPESTAEQPAERRIGRYLVRRKLGAGGFARVYLGWDPDLEIEVAIKVPKPQLAEDEGALDRFRREATTAAKLRHPNVVTVLTVGRLEHDFDGVPAEAPYLVMDYLPASLAGRLAATPVLPEREWLLIGTQVGRGLAYAHANGVVHRDIKPDNILFGRHEEAVLTDFGIARAVAEAMAPESRSVVVGTPEYFSPEQARGLPLDRRTDIYGLGVTLYRAATGVLPFTGVDWYAIMRQHVEDPPPLPRDMNPALSERAEALILNCLAKSPDERYQTVEELLADIEAARTNGASASTVAVNALTVDVPRAVVAYRKPRPPIVVAPAPSRWRWMLVAVPLAAASAGAAWWVARRATPAAGIAAADAHPVGPVITDSAAAPALPPPDSALRAALRPPDSLAPPVAAKHGGLAISAPPGAVVTVNGVSVGTAPWRNEAMAPGRYVVEASFPTSAGCRTATEQAMVDVRAGRQRDVRLEPVPCGLLRLDARTPDARYAVVAQGAGGTRTEGVLPLAQPLVLPAGSYLLTISAQFCAPYNDIVRITAGMATELPPVRLICERAKR